MISTLQIGSVTIGYCPIPEGETLTRRQRERAAVSNILEALLPGAQLAHNQDGAPLVEGVNISITHSQKLAAVAISSNAPVGIDAEEYRPALQRVKTRFLSPEELLWIKEDQDLLKAWTTKEAVYKALGIRVLTGPEIAIDPDFRSATAQTRLFSLHHFQIDSTLITLAI